MKVTSDYFDYQDAIAKVAVIQFHNRVYPEVSNSRSLKPYRFPDDSKSFGFEWNGCSIEVHCVPNMVRVPGTAIFVSVPILRVYGVDIYTGKLHFLKSVLATNGAA